MSESKLVISDKPYEMYTVSTKKQEGRAYPEFIDYCGRLYCKLPKDAAAPIAKIMPVNANDPLERDVIPPTSVPIDFYVKQISEEIPILTSNQQSRLTKLLEGIFDDKIKNILNGWDNDLVTELYRAYSLTLATLMVANAKFAEENVNETRIPTSPVSLNMYEWIEHPEVAHTSINTLVIEVTALIAYDASRDSDLITEYAAYLTGLLDARKIIQKHMWQVVTKELAHDSEQ